MNKNLIETMKRLRERELAIKERLKELKFECRVWGKVATELLDEDDKLKEDLEEIKKEMVFICGQTKVKR